MEEESSRLPAPGELALLQAFVNTVDREPGREDLHDPQALAAWLAGHELCAAGESCDDTDLARSLAVREAIRALLEANNGGAVDATAIETLNQAGEAAGLRLQFDGKGNTRLEPSRQGIDGALGRLLGIVYTAMVDGSWGRLKACRSETCRWAFYDRSKNHSGAWCAMATCGCREKARTYRKRKRSGDEVAQPAASVASARRR